MNLTAAHWVYAAFIVLVLVTTSLRRETPLVCIVASLVLSWVITGDLIKAVQADHGLEVKAGSGFSERKFGARPFL